MKRIAIVMLVTMATVAPAASAQLYKCAGADGKVTYQSEPCPVAAKEDRLRAPASPTPAEPAATAKPAEAAAASSTQGWDEGVLAKEQQKCVDELVRVTRAAWSNSQPYPEAPYRASSAQFCDCLVKRARATSTPAEFKSGANGIISKYMQEGIEGGECKPEGAVGASLQGVK